MKTLAFCVLAVLGTVIFLKQRDLAEKQDPTPEPVAAKPITPTAPIGEAKRYTGRILQHTGNGVLFQSSADKTYLLSGHPNATGLADDAHLSFYAYSGDLFQYSTVLGAIRTVRTLIYTENPASAPTPVPKQGDWMFKNYRNPLNR